MNSRPSIPLRQPRLRLTQHSNESSKPRGLGRAIRVFAVLALIRIRANTAHGLYSSRGWRFELVINLQTPGRADQVIEQRARPPRLAPGNTPPQFGSARLPASHPKRGAIAAH